jgi:opacity protein-like surface antigen
MVTNAEFALCGRWHGAVDRRGLESCLECADRGFDWGYGGGAAIHVTQSWALRGEWERHRLPFVGGSQNVDLWTAGIQYKF